MAFEAPIEKLYWEIQRIWVEATKRAGSVFIE